MSEENGVIACKLTQDELAHLQDGGEVLFELPGQFIERDPEIVVSVE